MTAALGKQKGAFPCIHRNLPRGPLRPRYARKHADCSVPDRFRQERCGTIAPMLRAGMHMLAALLWMAACQPIRTPDPVQVNVRVIHDGESSAVTSSGSVVRDVLSELDISLGMLDRVSPSEFTTLNEGMKITVTRVEEAVENEEVVVPFEKEVVRNEGLPVGETRLLQTGSSGLEEIAYRVVLEDGTEVAKAVLRRTMLKEPVTEIVMIGAHSSFTVIPIEGTLAYLSAGNAWMMRNSSGSRKPLTVTSTLDGRVFQLSGDGDYLLYTRTPIEDKEADSESVFNELWAVATAVNKPVPFAMQAENVLWAAWSPTEMRTLAFSTGEPRSTAPGWQAQNDLRLISFDDAGNIEQQTTVLEPWAGGSYGWYGMRFSWAPDGQRLAYAQADAIGLIDITDPNNPTQQRLTAFSHYQTYKDWVWIPAVTWSPDSRFLYTVTHAAPVGLELPEDSPVFHVSALPQDGTFQATLAERSGMWASPVVSPPGMGGFRVAFLQALNPLESDNSRYQLALMDQDGSNATPIFPAPGETGLRPQTVAWSPSGNQIALIHRSDLWIVEEDSGITQQLTKDAQTSSPTWAN